VSLRLEYLRAFVCGYVFELQLHLQLHIKYTPSGRSNGALSAGSCISVAPSNISQYAKTIDNLYLTHIPKQVPTAICEF